MVINHQKMKLFFAFFFMNSTEEHTAKAMDYINLLHASGMYEKQTAKIIPFRSIDIFENAVSAGTGNFLVDGPKDVGRILRTFKIKKNVEVTDNGKIII